MCSAPRDVAQIRLDNAMRLFDEFVSATIKHPDAAALRGLERRFAERLQIQPSYWSQIKSRSRQIGERLARQFEQLSHKPNGWMDQEHGAPGAAAPSPAVGFGQMAGLVQQGNGALSSASRQLSNSGSASLPQDDDERFIVGLVLTYYRRHPQRARTRLLDLLGEVLTPPTSSALNAPPAPAPKTAAPTTAAVDEWRKLQQSIAPLKPKKR